MSYVYSCALILLCVRILALIRANDVNSTHSVGHSKAQHHAYHVHSGDVVHFAIDKQSGLNPGRYLPLTHNLFQVTLLDKPEDFHSHFQFIAHANWTRLNSLIKGRAPAHVFPTNNDEVMDRFNNKVRWKSWMNSIGLGTRVPQNFQQDQITNQDFPIVLKTNEHFGHGVYVLHNAEDLANVTSVLKHKGLEYMLEESLTGWGVRELFIYGSAFQGRLLSLRCMMRDYSTTDAVKSAYRKAERGGSDVAMPDAEGAVQNGSVPFVRGFLLKSNQEHFAPCGRQLVDIHRKMLAATDYTGSFCTSLKGDKNSQPKIMEVNARYCGSVAGNDALFIVSFVPLVFAMMHAYPHNSTLHRALVDGRFARAFQTINANETRALQTGGGMQYGVWVSAETFDPDNRLDWVSYHLPHHKAKHS